MLKKKLDKKDQGFTIIEVMIVLAIAGLILLVVFLAVPALQRASRNTSRKTDVQALLAAMGEYSNNNDGLLPTVVTLTAGNPAYVKFSNAAGTATTSQSNVGYYTTAAGDSAAGFAAANGDIYLYNPYPAASVAQPALNTTGTGDYVELAAGLICSAPGAGGNQTGITLGATPRSYIALYLDETGNGTYTSECLQS